VKEDMLMYFITFSRKMGTNGSEIARRVADQLGYKFYDTEAIENAAREMGFLESVREIDEKAPSLFHRVFSSKPTVDIDRLDSVIYKLASQGNAVFLGRGSHILLRTFSCALHVRVTASLQKRIQNLVEKGLHQEAAKKAIEHSDHERSSFAKFAFGVDWESPELYDVVLNMDKLSVNLAIATVLSMARSSDIKACSLDAIRSLEMMALKSKADAALIEAGLIYGPLTYISVSIPESGKIQLTGFVEDKESKTKAEEVLRKVKDIESIDNQIRILPKRRPG
jgi:cytidylate kinase